MQELGVLWGLLAISIAFVAGSILAVVAAARQRRVVCPETREPVDVRCDAKQAVRMMFGYGGDRVVGCQRWPGREGCDRACEKQLGPVTIAGASDA